jgi:hypothetical protein
MPTGKPPLALGGPPALTRPQERPSSGGAEGARQFAHASIQNGHALVHHQRSAQPIVSPPVPGRAAVAIAVLVFLYANLTQGFLALAPNELVRRTRTRGHGRGVHRGFFYRPRQRPFDAARIDAEGEALPHEPCEPPVHNDASPARRSRRKASTSAVTLCPPWRPRFLGTKPGRPARVTDAWA